LRSIRRIAFALVTAVGVSVALLVLTPAGAAPGDLDPSFGSGGEVETPIGSNALVRGLAIQPDGKIVAGGVSSLPGAFTLVRYETNGALDASFGSGGISTGPCCGAFAVQLQADGTARSRAIRG
jgi:hypothetical protein